MHGVGSRDTGRVDSGASSGAVGKVCSRACSRDAGQVCSRDVGNFCSREVCSRDMGRWFAVGKVYSGKVCDGAGLQQGYRAGL